MTTAFMGRTRNDDGYDRILEAQATAEGMPERREDDGEGEAQ